MQTVSTKRVQKLITFSPQLYTHLEAKARRLGVTFPEYIRSLALEDIKGEVNDIIIASREMEEAIGASLDDYQTGRFSEFDPTDTDQLKALFEEK
ncbi:MAG: hypothetical protein N2691_02590 [Patescibacteria group bacterium]|nr:hypothetical protein [Patescibacteria group bacterium]